MSARTRLAALLAVAVAALGLLASFPPIAQDLSYHAFSDTRALWGIPHFGDVMSNLPFLAVGAWGLCWTQRRRRDPAAFADARESVFFLIFFAGVALVSLGSGYYHWSPSNATLVWDRLPMTIAFMSLFCAVVAERIGFAAGWRMLVPALAFGFLSVFYWHWTEQRGAGDLRPYAAVQFLPVLMIPLILWLFRGRYSHASCFYGVAGFYLLAKALEHFDAEVLALSQGWVSGHTLKHLAAAGAAWMVGLWLRDRRLYAADSADRQASSPARKSG